MMLSFYICSRNKEWKTYSWKVEQDDREAAACPRGVLEYFVEYGIWWCADFLPQEGKDACSGALLEGAFAMGLKDW